MLKPVANCLLCALVCGCASSASRPGPAAERVVPLTRERYTVRYGLDANQPLLAEYVLTSNMLAGTRFARRKAFAEDTELPPDHRVRPSDYTGSGYDRGHMVPAADMAGAETWMAESFLMSNVSPQSPGSNRFAWKELERQVREWAVAKGELVVATGPVFAGGTNSIGRPECPVPVPDAHYKAVYDRRAEKAVAFVVPNSRATNGLPDFVVTVDDVERLTGLDVLDAPPSAESSVDTNFWFSAARAGDRR